MNYKKIGSLFIRFAPAFVFAFAFLLCVCPVKAAPSSAASATGSSATASTAVSYSVSILGDSISNYANVAPTDYNIAYPNGDVDDVSKTWWMLTINDLGYTFCMDDAASGSRITPSAGDETGKPNFATDRRLSDLRKADGTTPDVILIMGGTNDLIESVPLDQFRTSYDALLKKIVSAQWYPNAKVVCLTILPRIDTDKMYTDQNGNTADDFNNVIREVAAANNLPVIDTNNCGITLANWGTTSIDGTHPSAAGMQLIAACVERSLPGILSGNTSAVSADISASGDSSTASAGTSASSDDAFASAAFFSTDSLIKTIARVANATNRKDKQTSVNPSKVSVMGDSISTFEETLPAGYKNQYPYGDLQNADQTWWNQTFKSLGYSLCVNDSAAGSRICGDVLENGDMPCFISNRRIMDLTAGDNAPVPGEVPGVILIFGGTNDHAQNQTQDDFRKDYGILLHKLKAYYPNSQIVCMNIIAHSDQDSDGAFKGTPWYNKAGESVVDFNTIIESVASENQIPCLDVHSCGIDATNAEQYTIDGLHPNAAGAALIANYMIANLPSVLSAG